jgi:outer membrane protein TolC
MRQQRARRAAQNLTLDVVRTYFQVAAAQKAIRITTQLLEDCRNRYKLIDKLSKARQITPFRAFEETRRFVQMEKRLTNYIRSYENSCVELRSQLGMHPAGTILVDDAILNEVPDFDFPNIDLMEQIALLERPELYETDMQKHINVLECRKTLVMMFPNVRIYGDFVNSSNSFLYHASWYELGIRAAYNLLKLPQQISKYIAYTEQVEADELRTFSQAIGIMAQVRMAHANLLANKERFQIDDRVYNTYKNNLKWAEKNQRITGELSNLELDHMRLETAEYEIERLLTLGNYYVSYYRVFNSMGISSLDRKSLYQLKTELRNARRRAAVELEKAKADYNEEKAARMSKQTMALKEMEKKVVNQPLTAANDVDFIAIYSATPQKAQQILGAEKNKK